MIFLYLVIELDERLGLVVVCHDAVVDDVLAGVISAAFLEGAALDALHDHCVRDHYRNSRCNLFACLGENLVEGICLREGARESVKEESVHSGDSLELALDHSFNYFVRYEASFLYEGLCLKAEFCACRDLLAEQGSCGDVVKVVLFYHCCGLGAFTCAWRAKEDVIFHVIGFVFCSVLFVKDVYVFEVASELVVVKSEAYDEVIWDLHGRIVDLDVFLV